MITIRPGSHVHTLIMLLSFVGEFPICSLHLLGSFRSYRDLIRKLTQEQEFRIPGSEDRFTCRLLTVSGKQKYKTVRFHKSGLLVLEALDPSCVSVLSGIFPGAQFLWKSEPCGPEPQGGENGSHVPQSRD